LRENPKWRLKFLSPAHARPPSWLPDRDREQTGAGMPLDVQDTFRRHGREALDFLTYCVMSVNSAPVLVYLVAEYRLRPTMAAALALHDAFCAATAPARVRVAGMVLPPRDPRFQSEMEGLRLAPATLLRRASCSTSSWITSGSMRTTRSALRASASTPRSHRPPTCPVDA
jgi:hypothetical protein